jgi:hypothetical protein
LPALPYLPFLAPLALLALRPNRCRQAWWIWAPMAVSAGFQCALISMLLRETNFLDTGVIREEDIQLAVAFVLATGLVWLLSPSIEGVSRRFGTLIAFVGALVLGVLTPWLMLEMPWLRPELPMLVLGACLGIFTLALNAAARTCQGRFGGSRFCLLVLAWQVAISMGIATLTAAVALLCSRSVWQILLDAYVLACWSYSVVLPFLVLSVVHPFWRQRLTAWLKLTEQNQTTSPAAIS